MVSVRGACGGWTSRDITIWDIETELNYIHIPSGEKTESEYTHVHTHIHTHGMCVRVCVDSINKEIRLEVTMEV